VVRVFVGCGLSDMVAELLFSVLGGSSLGANIICQSRVE
jgi:hypothetical protein